jgi:catechol 2,3-dioxygenase-like lactoylglutathione lyase family enzyme
MIPGTCNTALFVKNITVSKEFYTRILGLTIKLDFGKNIIFNEGVTIWEIQNQHIIPELLGVKTIIEKNNRFELYFETEDLEADYQFLKSEKVQFLHGIHEEPWGQNTFRFFDPDNHLIEIGESMSGFIRRFHKAGLTPEEISRKTSVPPDEIIRLI